ncbi:MAG: DMT family transporter [Actinobacteria bacterium]|nr:DMT family transporter [Actinomycetota bacterium]
MARWYLLLFAVCTGWGTIPLLLREIAASPGLVAFGRVAIAALGLGGVLLAKRGRPTRFPAPYRVTPWRAIGSGVLLSAHWLTMFIAFDRVPAGTVILIIFLSPVGVAALAPSLLGDHLTPRLIAAVFVGLLGVALIAGPSLDSADPTGLAMAGISMALLVALNLVAKPLAGIYGGLRLAFMETAVASLILLPVALTADRTPVGTGWFWLAVLGLAHTAGGVSLFLAALRHLPVTRVSVMSYLEPVSVVLLAWVVLSEVPTALTLAGGALVVLAGVLVISTGGRATPPEPVATTEVARVPG